MKKLALAVALLAPLAHAEIVLPADGGTADPYAYAHPALRSLVFVSPESRQMAILPPPPVFLTVPPLLVRSPSLMPSYPPTQAPAGINVSASPSNRDNANYVLQRAHAFGQKLYREENSPYLYFGVPNRDYGWLGLGAPYPPPGVSGFNQPPRPSNRDNTTYNLERAHRFSMDGYRRP